MKIALASAPQGAHPSAFVVFRDRLDVSIGKACQLGHEAVELALAQATDVEVPATRKVLDDNGMGLAAISTGRVFADQRVWLTSPDVAGRHRAAEILKDLIDVAVDLGARRASMSVPVLRSALTHTIQLAVPGPAEREAGRFRSAGAEIANGPILVFVVYSFLQEQIVKGSFGSLVRGRASQLGSMLWT